MKRLADPGAGVPRRFTFLELAVVMLLLALLTAVVVPSVGRVPRRIAVRSLVGTVESAFRDAALRARGSGHVVRVEANPRRNRLTVRGGGPEEKPGLEEDGHKGEGRESPVPDAVDYEFPKRTEWNLEEWRRAGGEEGKPVYRFYPSGEAEGPVLTVNLRGSTFRIEVDPLTGRPRVEREE